MLRPHLLSLSGIAFFVAAGFSAKRPLPPPPGALGGFVISYPAPAYAASSCSVAALACANDTSPGCEILCDPVREAVCVEGRCTAGGNVATPNRCACE